jgi:SanA protein
MMTLGKRGRTRVVAWLRRRRRSLLLVMGSIAVVAIVAILYAAHRIEKSSSSALQANLNSLPHKHVALVLGCSPVLSSGAPNWYFENRIAAAAAAFQAQKVDYLLVSGDNHTVTYDEPTAMQQALVRLGVPEDRIVLDYAGFSTLDSVVRAKKVFGLSEFCVITQRDHALRAIYIAKANGIDAVGFPAKDVSKLRGLRTRCRESLARVRTLLDVHVLGRKPHFLGPAIVIGQEPNRAATTPASRRA